MVIFSTFSGVPTLLFVPMNDKPSMIPIRLLDVSKIKEEVGFETEISLKDGLKNTIEWYKENKNE